MANPYEQFRITPAPSPTPQDNPYAKYGQVRPGPPKPADRSTWNMLDNYMRQFAAGASMYTADELAAAGDVALNRAFAPDTAGGYAEAIPYADILKMHRDRDRQFEKEYPITSGVAQAGGALAMLPAAVPKALWAAGRTMLGTMGRGALGGGALGGAAGFGQGEGDFGSRLKSAGYGGGAGAGAGTILPPLISGLATGAKALGGRWAAENVGAPALDKLADITSYLVPKRQPGNLSAAAPEGGPSINVSGMMDDLATGLRTRADSMRNITEREGMDRVAQAIMRRGVPTERVGRDLLDMGPDATLANAGGVSAQNLLRTAYMMPGAQAQAIKDALEAQAAGASRRVRAPFEGQTPPPTMYDATRYLSGAPEGSPFGTTPAMGQGHISQVGREVYGPLRRSGVQVSDDMKRLIETTPALKEAYDGIVAEAAHLGKTLTPFDLHHGLKRQMNMAAEGRARTSGTPVNKEWLDSLADRWQSALYTANPEVQAADRVYAQTAILPDRLGQGYSWMRTGAGAEDLGVSRAALADQFPRMPPSDQTVFRVGSTNAVRDITDKGTNASRALARNIADSEGIQEKIATVYGPDQGRSIMRMSRTERDMGEMKNRVMANSQTAAVLSDMAEQGGLPKVLAPGSGTLTSRAWDALADWGRKQAGGNEAVRDAYTRILLETNPGANLKNLELLEALIAKRLAGSVAQSGTAGAVGAAGPDFATGRRFAHGGIVPGALSRVRGANA